MYSVQLVQNVQSLLAPETTSSSTTTTTLPTRTTTPTPTPLPTTTTTTTETPTPTHRDRPFDDPDTKYDQVRINSFLTLKLQDYLYNLI